MHNLLRLILKYSNFLLFLAMEVAAFIWLFSEQKYQQSTFLKSSNVVVASLNMLLTNTDEYFHLREENESLAEENARLREMLNNYQGMIEDSVERDSSYVYAHLQWGYEPAKVVDVMTNSQHNYLVLNKGEREGVREGQGVLSHNGVVGIVSAVNRRFAQVIPVIHPKMRLSCRIRRNGQMGFLVWSGPSPGYADLTDIGRHIEVAKGDTIETNGLTGLFPEGVMIGLIEDIELPDGDTYYKLKVKLGTDFKSLRYVQIVHNPLAAEQDSMRLFK
ncbi:MAG: rod shape-determining protein MreC [Paludibacteraceae bacterium]|nr:rod shape-determining protein MreC [Paludibacteraceae bacterium]